MLRPYQEWFGRVLILEGLQSPRYRGKEALCVGYDDPTKRLVVWPLDTGNQILVEPQKCCPHERYTIEDCRKEIREQQSEERRMVAKSDECSICLEEPRAPVELPCLHRFCGSCLARLRSPRDLDFELRCPNCRALMPAMFEKLLETAQEITMRMINGMICSDAGCISSFRHSPGGCIISDDALAYLKKNCEDATEEKTILPFLHSCEDLLHGYAKSATIGHKSASPVKAHRDLMRGVVCKLMPEVMKLRRQHEGCLHVRSTCGGIDSKLEKIFMEAYGKPLLSPEEQKARLTNKQSQFTGTARSNDEKYTKELTMMIAENLEGAWCYIRSFGLHYNRILIGFSNAAGQLVSYDASLRKMLTEEWEVNTWAMRRLDAMEELFQREGAYGKYEAQEAYLLIQLLFNITFVAVGEREAQVNMFIRTFGQEYLWKEIEGGIDKKAREIIFQRIGSQLRKQGYTDEFDRPLLLVRPCATPRCVGMLPGCRIKESRPNEFIRCKCKRMVYCSPSCMMMHEASHAGACVEALRARKRLGEK